MFSNFRPRDALKGIVLVFISYICTCMRHFRRKHFSGVTSRGLKWEHKSYKLERSISVSEKRPGEIHAHARNLESTPREGTAVNLQSSWCVPQIPRSLVYLALPFIAEVRGSSQPIVKLQLKKKHKWRFSRLSIKTSFLTNTFFLNTNLNFIQAFLFTDQRRSSLSSIYNDCYFWYPGFSYRFHSWRWWPHSGQGACSRLPLLLVWRTRPVRQYEASNLGEFESTCKYWKRPSCIVKAARPSDLRAGLEIRCAAC